MNLQALSAEFLGTALMIASCAPCLDDNDLSNIDMRDHPKSLTTLKQFFVRLEYIVLHSSACRYADLRLVLDRLASTSAECLRQRASTNALGFRMHRTQFLPCKFTTAIAYKLPI